MPLYDIKKVYSVQKKDINNRIKEFRKIWQTGDEKEFFKELVFCLLTPQSKAKKCWSAVVRIVEGNLLCSAEACQIVQYLNGVRFHNNKAQYICEAQKKFTNNGNIFIVNKIKSFLDVFIAREWLVKNIKGMGYKEASHFLRNIGFGKDIAILDRHILKNLKGFNVIRVIPDSLNRKKYLEIEKKMRVFADSVEIPLEHLDLLFWCRETGEIFK